MIKKVPEKKIVNVPLEEKYDIIQENFGEYLRSLNLPAITGACVVPVLALEVVITDERMAKPIELLVEEFSKDLVEQTLTVIKIKKPEEVDEE